MLIWEGRGWLGILGLGASHVIGQELAVKGLSLWLAYGATAVIIGGAIFWYAKRLEAEGSDHIVFDPKTGANARVTLQHRFMFIPLKWWGVICAFGGFAKPFEQMIQGM